ncbi:Uncharacterised protein [Chryseobacterium nakagawai]|uniref:Uncharacterized protein n=1 Tax=Chryseobacterium nakagawai TaxID=1241982 RepID=A0AAD0YN91_CHRNA|nr:hypothetical protein [Chryseobacterium nakagawai]AZA90301.1 hypothetical protein EG343_06560 [Chryseobacterium nakagawai]VEH21782.1 Uncharacterised protein [Chryseobacterium nakagawai]
MNRKTPKKVPVAQRPAAVTEPEMVQEEIMPFVLRHEDEIVNYIKEKAIKETMKSLAPLLEKLEEAVKQQEAAPVPVTATPSELPSMNYEEQLKKLQEASTAKLRQKEIKIVDRMNKLNARFGNIRP